NDVFDWRSDLANPRKGGIEGDVIRDAVRARQVHRGILVAAAVTGVLLMVWLMARSSGAAAVTLALVVAGVLLYSIPVARFKERPFLDSVTSSLHFAGPMIYALVLTGAELSGRQVWPI